MSLNPALTHVLILGGGISGVASALSLASAIPPTPFTLYELRPFPSTIGGAVGLTPPALRILDSLSVLSHLDAKCLGCDCDAIEIFSIHSGRRLGEIDFQDVKRFGYKGRRIMRKELLEGMLAALEEKMKKTGVGRVVYGKKVTALVEKEDEGIVDVRFEDGTNDTGDLVLGCDGIHSATRMAFVEPERMPVYSGIAVAYGIADADGLKEELHFKDAAVNSSRQGSLMTAFCNAEKTKMCVTAIMEAEAQGSREGWKTKGADQEIVRQDIWRRFEVGAFPVVRECLERTEEWFLYPVFKLSPQGRWYKGRVMLLGDAAHAMPPQGESIGLALEDVVLFVRTLAHYGGKTLIEIFEIYEGVRRKRIDEAYEAANYQWETVKDAGWLGNKIKEFFTPWYLWWTQKSRADAFAFDVLSTKLPA